MAASSSCSDSIPQEKHDVFLSFRGEDTRNNFTSHLYEALRRSKIQTYIDYDLERGDEIAPALLKAISESKLSVIIFSKNYASSAWCLDELVHILECRDEQFVIPIFYGVDPSDVRKQFGSYADAFVEHEKRFKDSMDKVLRWRKALTTAVNISGFDSQTIRPESDLVKIVVNDILAKLNLKSEMASGLEGLVGIEKHVRQVKSLLCLDSQDVRTVGIWGMGGIGKTTIADVVFHLLSSQFEACCFIANVREASETRHGLNDLRNQLLRTVLKEDNLYVAAPSIGSMFARQRLCCTKALVVLDDVSDLGQVKFLVGGDRILFGPGSRIIVTARDKRMLGVDDDKIYKVNLLDCDEALELFHLRALTNLSPPTDYTTLSREVVDYAGGNPLALTILGSVIFCHCESKKDWEDELDRLKKFPNKRIQNVLRFSYDGLEENEREIFLDIACYHKGKYINEAKRILDASGFCANAGVKILVDMSLISVGKCSTLEMHDLIQEMGREIVRDECVKNPGKRSRLSLANDVCHVLTNNTGTEDIECMAMNMDLIKDLCVNVASFEKMNNLRFLDLYSYSSRGVNKLHLPPGFEFLPEALKYLRWHFYPLTSLPLRFSSENLVELHMPNSRLEQLWNKGVQINLGSIKRIDLSHSEHLADVSALIESPNLESIDLWDCKSLVQLPSSFQNLAKLTSLSLDDCSNLKILPEMPSNLEVLGLNRTAIEELPSSIWSLKKLRHLDLEICEELKNLPSSTCRLNSLSILVLDRCGSLESLSVELPSGLKELYLISCKSLGSLPVELPSGLKKLSLISCKSLGSLPVELPSGLKRLDLTNCKSLGSLPVELPSGLKKLELRNCKSLGSLPVELPSGLKKLDLRNCKSLGSLPVDLPSGLEYLELISCKSLGSLPVELPSGLEYLDLSDCESLGSLPVELPSGLKRLDLTNCKSLGSLPVELPSGLKRLELRNCKSLVSLPVELPSGLEYPDLSDCESLGSLPVELPSWLKRLDLRNCKSLGSLPVELPSGLEYLELSDCESLGSLPVELPSGLKELKLINCKSLGSLPVELPSGLKELKLINCKSLGSLPVELPSGLKELYLSDCESLRSLPVELPSALKELKLINCESLGSLPVELPSGLKELYLSDWESLGSLPVELPSGLKRLDLRNCKSLGSLPVELPSGLEELKLRNCKSLGSLPVELPSGLEYLDLSDCESLGSLPVELPSGLKRLDLRNCKSLGSLPKLPWLLALFIAHGCTSLETVSSPMRTAPIQGRDQYVNHSEEFEELLFMNCVKLDQSARSNIMAYAQLRFMRIATASRLLNKRRRIKIVCPGNEIPKWMRYQSEGCSINIKLPPHSFRQGFLGYAVCSVVAFNNYTPPDPILSYFSCETHHKTNISHEVCREDHRISLPPILINSDHVFVWYFCPRFVGFEIAINREYWVKASEASFDFKLYQNTEKERNHFFDPSTVRVKRCGVSLLYAQEIEKLLGGIDEDEVMEPKQAVEEEDIIIKTKRRRDESELSGSGTASFKEEYNDQLPPQSSKRKINIM